MTVAHRRNQEKSAKSAGARLSYSNVMQPTYKGPGSTSRAFYTPFRPGAKGTAKESDANHLRKC